VGKAEHYRFKYLQEEAIPQKQECLEANEKTGDLKVTLIQKRKRV